MKLVLVRPFITEESMKDAQKSIFTFEVAKTANKTAIKKEVEKVFSVNVKGVRTVTIKRSKVVMTKFGRKETNSVLKKARVELVKGQMIPAFEVKEEKKEKKAKKEDKA